MTRSSALLLSFSLVSAFASACKDPNPTFVFDAGTAVPDASDARTDVGDADDASDAEDDGANADAAADAEAGANP